MCAQYKLKLESEASKVSINPIPPVQVVGQKQQTLEVGEEQSMIREEKLQKQIYELNVKLSMANARSDILQVFIVTQYCNSGRRTQRWTLEG